MKFLLNSDKKTVFVTEDTFKHGEIDHCLNIANHSPTGLTWGYMGSGCTQTALAILFCVTENTQISQMLKQKYKEDVISNLDQEKSHEIKESEVWEFIDANMDVDNAYEELKELLESKESKAIINEAGIIYDTPLKAVKTLYNSDLELLQVLLDFGSDVVEVKLDEHGEFTCSIDENDEALTEVCVETGYMYDKKSLVDSLEDLPSDKILNLINTYIAD